MYFYRRTFFILENMGIMKIMHGTNGDFWDEVRFFGLLGVFHSLV